MLSFYKIFTCVYIYIHCIIILCIYIHVHSYGPTSHNIMITSRVITPFRLMANVLMLLPPYHHHVPIMCHPGPQSIPSPSYHPHYIISPVYIHYHVCIYIYTVHTYPDQITKLCHHL